MLRSNLRLYTRYSLAVLLVLTQSASSSAESARLLPGALLNLSGREPGLPLQTDPVSLHIVVVEGEDGVNIVKKKTAVQPVVEVRDKNNLPVGGAVVTFTAPSHGASAVFLNGSRSVTLVTNSAGRAAVTGLQPVSTGSFNISVTASFNGQLASTTIAQTNFLTASAAAAGGSGAGAAGGLSTAAIVGIVAGVAAAAAVGLGVGLTRGGSSAAVPVTGSIGGPGSTTVGAPH